MHLWLITSWKSRLVDLYYYYRVAEHKTIIIPVLLQPSVWNRNDYNNLRSSSVAMNAEREWIRYRTRTWANIHQRRMTLSSNIIKAFLLPPTLVECSKTLMQNLHPSPPFKGWEKLRCNVASWVPPFEVLRACWVPFFFYHSATTSGHHEATTSTGVSQRNDALTFVWRPTRII